MAVKVSYKAGVLALTALLLACSQGELMLQGDRVTPRAAAEGGAVAGTDDAAALSTGATPVDSAHRSLARAPSLRPLRVSSATAKLVTSARPPK